MPPADATSFLKPNGLCTTSSIRNSQKSALSVSLDDGFLFHPKKYSRKLFDCNIYLINAINTDDDVTLKVESQIC